VQQKFFWGPKFVYFLDEFFPYTWKSGGATALPKLKTGGATLQNIIYMAIIKSFI
jgi:hypothetical protein